MPPKKKKARTEDDKEWSTVAVSDACKRTTNPIRAIVDKIAPDPNHPKQPCLKLSIGDPTLDGNLLPPPNAIKAISEGVTANKFNGYPPSVGYEGARAAVAKYHFGNFVQGQCGGAEKEPKAYTAGDVVLASGASHALEMSFGALCNAGDNILLPKPGFSLYNTLCENKQIKKKFYACDPSKNWEADLASIESQIDGRTKAILLNNPSNPCGSNFSREHLVAFLALAEKYRLTIIADEIYAGLVFEGETFTSVAAISTSVPCLIVGGTAKNFLAPGWRIGWVIRHDPKGVLSEVWPGIIALSTLLVGPNALVQGVLDEVINGTSAEWMNQLKATLGKQAMLTYDACHAAKGLKPIKPQGAMYLMVGIDFDELPCFDDDVAFSSALMKEENVQVLPGTIFGAPGFIRIVFTKPEDQLREAVKRIAEFVAKNVKKDDEEKKVEAAPAAAEEAAVATSDE